MGNNSMQENEELRLSDGFRHEQMFVLNPQAADAFRKLTGEKTEEEYL